MDIANVKSILRTSDCITLDVDSTVFCDETIDELAKFCGKEDDILPVTISAMEGHLDFGQALVKRMQILNITREKLETFKANKIIRYTPNVRNFIKLLQIKRIPVYLITGGFHETVDAIARDLDIPQENVFANRIIFDNKGNYLRIDENELTSKDNGKYEVIKSLKRAFGFKNVVHIGDGMNDAIVCPAADAFIGYGGVHVREKVKQLAGWYVTDFQELIDELSKQI